MLHTVNAPADWKYTPAERRRAARRRWALAAFMLCLLALIAIWRIGVAWEERDVAFVASASGLPLPAHPRDAVFHDNGQFAIVGAIDLTEDERDAILRTGKLHPAAHGETRVSPQQPSDFRAIARLPAAVRDIEGAGDLHHGGGCTLHQSWIALLDRSSDRIWIEVSSCRLQFRPSRSR
jgi:hypothetical protein